MVLLTLIELNRCFFINLASVLELNEFFASLRLSGLTSRELNEFFCLFKVFGVHSLFTKTTTIKFYIIFVRFPRL